MSTNNSRLSLQQQLLAAFVEVWNAPKQGGSAKPDFQQLQGLLLRNGLLQTCLYVARKRADKGSDEAVVVTFELLVNVLRKAMPEVKAEALQGSGTLASLDRARYQYLTRLALQVCELGFSYCAAVQGTGSTTA